MISILWSVFCSCLTTVVPLALTIKSLDASLTNVPIQSYQFLLNYWMFYIGLQYIQYQFLNHDQMIIELVFSSIKIWLFYGKRSNLMALNTFILNKIWNHKQTMSGRNGLMNLESTVIDPILKKYFYTGNVYKHTSILHYYLAQLGNNYYNNIWLDENDRDTQFQEVTFIYLDKFIQVIRYFMVQFLNYTGDDGKIVNSHLQPQRSLSPTSNKNKLIFGKKIRKSNSMNSMNSSNVTRPSSSVSPPPYPTTENDLTSLLTIDPKPRSVSNEYPINGGGPSLVEETVFDSRRRARSIGEVGGNESFRITPLSIKAVKQSQLPNAHNHNHNHTHVYNNVQHSVPPPPQQQQQQYPNVIKNPEEQLNPLPTPQQHLMMKAQAANLNTRNNLQYKRFA